MGEECDATITARPGPRDRGILRLGVVNGLSFAFMIVRRAGAMLDGQAAARAA
jgi:hypothetical protein